PPPAAAAASMARFTASVSTVLPSPVAPKSCTLKMPASADAEPLFFPAASATAGKAAPASPMPPTRKKSRRNASNVVIRIPSCFSDCTSALLGLGLSERVLNPPCTLMPHRVRQWAPRRDSKFTSPGGRLLQAETYYHLQPRLRQTQKTGPSVPASAHSPRAVSCRRGTRQSRRSQGSPPAIHRAAGTASSCAIPSRATLQASPAKPPGAAPCILPIFPHAPSTESKLASRPLHGL